MKRLPLWTALSLALCLGACGKPGVDAKRIEAAAAGEWLSYGRTYDEQRFSPLDKVNRETVARLGVAWWAEFDTDRGQEATPLVADGVLYTTTAWSKVYAFDARTGKPLWSYDPKVPGEKGADACCDVVNRGAAIWKGRIYVGTLDGRLIALDAKSGEVAWDVQTTDRTRAYTITGAPRVIKGKVLIGNGGAEYGVRGYVSAYDADSGKLVWRFYTTPNPKGFRTARPRTRCSGRRPQPAGLTGSGKRAAAAAPSGTRSPMIPRPGSSTSVSATATRGTTSCAAAARATTFSWLPSSR